MKNFVFRLLACLLIACMLLPCAALAESNKGGKSEKNAVPAENTAEAAGETVLWSSEDGLLSIEIPAAWTEMDPEMMMQLLHDQIEAGAMDEAGMNEAIQQSMMEAEGLYALFYGPDWTSNLNISVEDSNGVDVIKYASLLIPSVEAQYETVGVTLDVAEVRTIGAHECIVIEADYLGSWITQAILMSPDKSKTLTFTFTDFSPEIRDAVVGSIVFAE